MDAVKYLKEKRRMTQECDISCRDCLLGPYRNGAGKQCDAFAYSHPEDAVRIVENWSAEHPVKTRQSEFLKMFPNAQICEDRETLGVCPRTIDTKSVSEEECGNITCIECKKRFWHVEVE